MGAKTIGEKLTWAMERQPEWDTSPMKIASALALVVLSLIAAASGGAAEPLLPCPPPPGPGPQAQGDRSPVWAPSGSLLALVSLEYAPPTVEIADARSHARRSLGIGEAPTWSPDGHELALTRSVPVQYATCEGFGPAVFVISADGGSARRLTDAPQESGFNPTWSPDGSRIAFSFSTPTSTGIAVVPVSGGSPVIITSHRVDPYVYDNAPVWSPGGQKLAFSRETSSQPGSRIWTISADGSDARLLTHASRYWDSSPSWSPDGRKIVFSRSAPLVDRGQSRIWVMKADGTGKRRASPRSRLRVDSEPQWSPNGGMIAFSRWGNGSTSVFTVRADGSHLHRIGLGQEPRWSADGSRIALVRWPRNLNNKTTIWIAPVKPGRPAARL